MPPEDSSNIFVDRMCPVFFNDEHIDLFRFCPKLMFVFKGQVFPFLLQFNLYPGKKMQGAIGGLLFSPYAGPPYEIISGVPDFQKTPA